jgi:hypothetical protein
MLMQILLFPVEGVEFEKDDRDSEVLQIQGILPGINFPMARICVLITCMLVMFVSHEIGHAVAAVHVGIEVVHQLKHSLIHF